MGTPIADRLELLDEDWLAETIDDSLDVDWTGRVAARLIIDRMPEITEAASVIRELVEALDGMEAKVVERNAGWSKAIERGMKRLDVHHEYARGAETETSLMVFNIREIARQALSRARGEG